MTASLTSTDLCLVVAPGDDTWLDNYLNRHQNEPVESITAVYLDGCEPRALLETLLTVSSVILSPRWASHPLGVLAVTAANALDLPAVTTNPDGNSVAAVLATASTAADATPDENRDELPHEEAARLVHGPRGDFYDHPFDNFARTALIWTGVLYSKLKPGESVQPEDVSLCMVGVKMAREAFRHKRDNRTDAHGYLMTHEMVLEERARRERDNH